MIIVKRDYACPTMSSLAGNPIRTWQTETLKAERRLGRGRYGFPINVERQVQVKGTLLGF